MRRATVLLLLCSCASSTTSTSDVVDVTGLEAASDVALDAAGTDRFDALDTTEEFMEVSDAASDLTDREDAVGDQGNNDALDVPVEDAAPDSDPERDCPRDPPSGPPPESSRSCATGGVPAWHCREVPYCGGRYRMGSTEAWEVFLTRDRDNRSLQMRTCDVHDAVVRGGYVDAYEVTVARYRQWVNAGFPHPANDEVFFSGLRWASSFNRQLVVPGLATANERVPGVETTDSMCTWSATQGVRDDLPINCVPPMAAWAFCWWEGKHMATEIAWEFLATNRGTTRTPFGDGNRSRGASIASDVARS